MALSTKVLIGVGIVGAIFVAVVMASRQANAPQGEMAAPISLAQAAAMAQSAAPASGAAATAAGASATAPGASTTATSPRRKLLFFLNPDGYPCQSQMRILNGVADSLSKLAEVVYIRTTVPADMQLFEAFGIRALPSLVIADKAGRELSRFSPGIQSGEAVLAALTK